MDLIKIVLVFITPNGSILDRSELHVCKFRKVSLLKEYLKRVLCLNGTLQLNSRADTLEGIKSGDIVEIKNCYHRPKKLQSLPLTIYPQGLQRTINIPATITIELLKFVIECEHGILMENQVLRKDHEIWRHNDYSQYKIKDLEGLQIEDTSCLIPIMCTESTANSAAIILDSNPDKDIASTVARLTTENTGSKLPDLGAASTAATSTAAASRVAQRGYTYYTNSLVQGVKWGTFSDRDRPYVGVRTKRPALLPQIVRDEKLKRRPSLEDKKRSPTLPQNRLPKIQTKDGQ